MNCVASCIQNSSKRNQVDVIMHAHHPKRGQNSVDNKKIIGKRDKEAANK